MVLNTSLSTEANILRSILLLNLLNVIRNIELNKVSFKNKEFITSICASFWHSVSCILCSLMHQAVVVMKVMSAPQL